MELIIGLLSAFIIAFTFGLLIFAGEWLLKKGIVHSKRLERFFDSLPDWGE